ncbi:unnamed protein product [Heligmosomoides polygyrus]|uniref:Secreted protein n=1 Tax=Heligmosomoides polygyrus TaxID=6339 RepID=A0A183FQ37_HELPZ|nr:unnamed protein product [Heligmosomoides polygyrus]
MNWVRCASINRTTYWCYQFAAAAAAAARGCVYRNLLGDYPVGLHPGTTSAHSSWGEQFVVVVIVNLAPGACQGRGCPHAQPVGRSFKCRPTSTSANSSSGICCREFAPARARHVAGEISASPTSLTTITPSTDGDDESILSTTTMKTD